MKFLVCAAPILLIAFGFATPAMADNCGPLQQIGSIDLEPLGNHGLMLVPVSINGTPKKMLLDTGGGITSLTKTAVESLNLHPMDSRVRLVSTNGNASRRYVRLEAFQMGNMQAKDVSFMVAPNHGAGQNSDGVITGDVMSHYDVAIDFAAHKLDYFSPIHCPGHVVYWPAQAIAVVPFTLNRPARTNPAEFGLPNAKDSHIRIPVTIDGKQIVADINTGTANSTMSANTAQYVFGITADSPGSVPLGTASNDSSKRIFGHVFGSMDFDGVAVTNPHIVIRPDLTGANDPDNVLQAGTHIARVDDNLADQVTVGMDVLKHLHLFVAYSEDTLYITPASQPGTQAETPKP